jgi:hypothetical protein
LAAVLEPVIERAADLRLEDRLDDRRGMQIVLVRFDLDALEVGDPRAGQRTSEGR